MLKTHFWAIPLALVRQPTRVTLRDGRVFLAGDLMDIWAVKEIVLDQQYGFYGTPNPQWTVVDVGAGIGDFDVLIGPSVARVVAFEADRARAELARRNLVANGIENVEIVAEAVTSLDSIFAQHRIYGCDLLKMDCEGCEYGLIEEASYQTLEAIDRIVMEIHLFDEDMRQRRVSLHNKLESSGFVIQEKPNPVHDSIRFLYAYRSSRVSEVDLRPRDG